MRAWFRSTIVTLIWGHFAAITAQVGPPSEDFRMSSDQGRRQNRAYRRSQHQLELLQTRLPRQQVFDVLQQMFLTVTGDMDSMERRGKMMGVTKASSLWLHFI